MIGDGEALVFIDAIFFLDSLYPSSHCREGRPGLFHWHVVDEGRQRRERQCINVVCRLYKWVSEEYHVGHVHSIVIVSAEGIHTCLRD